MAKDRRHLEREHRERDLARPHDHAAHHEPGGRRRALRHGGELRPRSRVPVERRRIDVGGRRQGTAARCAPPLDRGSPRCAGDGNDAGVFVSFDAGTTWSDLTRNLPSVMVVDLIFHRHNRTLTAATYGRSLWRLSLS